MFETVHSILNEAGVELRTEMLENREHWVVPTVAITEGVHSGSRGPILYLENEIGKNPANWDHKPAIIYHPLAAEDGQRPPPTAASQEVINNQKVGIPLDSRWEDSKLKMNTWLDKERLKEVSEPVYNALSKKQKVEVSTGLKADIEWTKGVWNDGTEYVGIARNIRPDHLAILPDQTGACDISKGAGLLQNNNLTAPITNEASLSDIQCAASMALSLKFQKPGYYWNGWVSDVYPEYVIYYDGGDYYQQNYKMKDGKAELTGDPVKVVRETVYRSVNNTLVGTTAGKHYTIRELLNMTKKEKIDAIIKNSKGTMDESDREWLDKKKDAALDALLNQFKTPEPAPDEEAISNAKKKKEAEEAKKKKDAEDAAVLNAGGKTKVMTEEEWLAAAPKGKLAVLNRAEQKEQEAMAKLITTITNAKGNKFTKTYLESKDLPELEAIASLIAPPVDETVENRYSLSRFIGAGGVEDQTLENANATVGLMPTEEMDYDADYGDLGDNRK
jgi:hypothetical protein